MGMTAYPLSRVEDQSCQDNVWNQNFIEDIQSSPALDRNRRTSEKGETFLGVNQRAIAAFPIRRPGATDSLRMDGVTTASLEPAAYPRWLPWLLGFLTAIGPASIDMYLPAFPAIEASFGVPSGSAQITLASYFAGLAIGQISQGTLSDRFGRRGPIMVGTAIYAAASIGAALSPNIFWLSVFRALSAFGGAAGTVIPRAMVRDLATGHKATVIMGQLTLVLGVAPILAPSIGGMVLMLGSWRWIFAILAVYAASCTFVVWRLLPDTLPRERRIPLHPGQQIRRFRGILRERFFISHAAMACAASIAFYAYLAGSSPVFIRGFGLSPSQFGLLFGLCSVALIANSQINARLVGRFGISRVLRIVARVHLCATAVLAIVGFSGHPTFLTVLVPLLVAVSCMGFLNPNTTVGALTNQAYQAGSASALMGTMQFLLGAVGGLVVGFFTDGTPRGMAALMVTGSVLLVITDLLRPVVERR
jgi:MFS transporter, DHA1 family, multidrug resistance protein